jgi:cytochrome P450
METTTPSCPVSLGESFNPLAGDQLEDPYPIYEQARRTEPVFFSPAYGMWVVTTYRDAKTVVSNPNLFSSRDSVSPIVEICPEAYGVLSSGVPFVPVLVNSDPPAHERWRKVAKNGFSGRRMRQLEPQIREITNARIDSIEPAGRAEMMREIAYPIPLHTIARLFDVDDDHIDDLKRWSLSFLHLVSAHLDTARQVQVATEVVDFQLFIRDHIERKRREPGEDLVSQLIAGGGDDPFSEDELVTQIVGFLMAGHETTTNSIGNSLNLLLTERARWEAIVADRSLIPAAFEEVLRVDTSVPTFLRTATADTELAGQKISAGDRVLVAYGSANRDAEVFEDPDSFRLDRRNDSPHMGFGAGIHYCVGAPLARLQGRVVLDCLADRLPTLRLPEQELRRVPTLMFRGFEEIYVEWDPSPSS